MGLLSDRYRDVPTVTPDQRELSEAVSRLPYKLVGPATITHFPLFNISIEDERFLRQKQQFLTDLEKLFSDPALFSGLHQELYWDDLRSYITKYKNKPGLTGNIVDIANQMDLEHLCNHLITILCKRFRILCENRFELVAFECSNYLLIELNRYAQQEMIKELMDDEEEFVRKWCPRSKLEDIGDYAWLYRLINVVTAHFFRKIESSALAPSVLRGLRSSVDREISKLTGFNEDGSEPSLSPDWPDVLGLAESQARLGGMIATLEAAAGPGAQLPDGYIGAKFTDRNTLALREWSQSASNGIEASRYLLWDRGNHAWRYTFHDGTNLNSATKDDVKDFVERLLSTGDVDADFDFSLKDEDQPVRWQKITARVDDIDAFNFPGRRLGGATYYVFEVELLFLIYASAWTGGSEDVATGFRTQVDALLRRYLSIEEKSHEVERQAQLTRKELVEKYVNTLWYQATANDNRREALENDRSMAVQGSELVDTYLELLSPEDDLKTWISDVGSKMRYICRYQGGDELILRSKRRANIALAQILSKLWAACFEKFSGRAWIDADDFIASTIIDGRAIYFSNFRPYEFNQPKSLEIGKKRWKSAGFTRTFFVDLGLSDYQRGRVVRRLADLATYRLSCVRDFERVRALGYGLNELHTKLGRIQRSEPILQEKLRATRVSISDARTKGAPKAKVGELLRTNQDAVDSLVQNLRQVQTILSKLSEFNGLIVGGISDRRSQTDSHMDRIRHRVEDLRIERIHGYARLDEFVERGVGRATREIARTAERYENLRVRCQQHLSGLTTDIAALEANTFSLFSIATDGSLKDLRGLFSKADLLIVLGGGYYLVHLIEKGSEGWGVATWFISAVIFLLVLKKFWPRIDRYIEGVIDTVASVWTEFRQKRNP